MVVVYSDQIQITHQKHRIKKTTPTYPFNTPSIPIFHPVSEVGSQIQISHPKKRLRKTTPEFDTWFSVLPFLIALSPPMQPYIYKQFQRLWKNRVMSKRRRPLIKTFLVTNISSLIVTFQQTAAQPYLLKQFIPIFKRKLLKRKRFNLKFGHPKTITYVTTNPVLQPIVYASAIQPDINKQLLARRIKIKIAKRRHLVFKTSPQYQTWFFLFVARFAAVIQPYLLKQLIPHWKRKVQARRRLNLKRFPQFQTWFDILTSLSASIYQSPTEPYVAKQLIPKLKKKLQLRRRFNMKFGTPKYQAWWATNPALSPSVWVSSIQPYLLKQLLPKFKKHLLARKRFNAKYGTPQFKQWFKVLPTFIPSAAVIQPYVYLNLFTKWKHKLEARKKRLIATRAAENYRMVSWVTNIHEVVTAITLTVIDILLKTLRLPK